MLITRARLVPLCVVALAAGAGAARAQSSSYPPSTVITDISFDMTTLQQHAPGSDNWIVTWSDDGHQYTSFGDGGGFGGTDNDGRVSMGVARIEGGKDSYVGINVNGGKNPESGNSTWSSTGGKSLGIISIDLSGSGGQRGTLFMYRNGTGSEAGAFEQTELYRSLDHGRSWSYTGVRWTDPGFFSPSFLQFGQDYAGARDEYVYSYAPTNQNTTWEVQPAGEILLFRVRKDQLASPGAWEYFSGTASNPSWSSNLSNATPVFADPANGVMRTSVSYNAPLGRYILITQQVSRFEADDYHIGIYDAPQPWGPWTTVFFGNPRVDLSPSLNSGSKTVFWNLSNKWLSADGRDFVMVYTGPGPDNMGTVEGRFVTVTDTSPPSAPQNLVATGSSDDSIGLSWSASSDPQSGISHYRIRRDGTTVAQPPGTTFVDTGLAEATAYTYQVSAVNGAGLESTAATTVASTLADLTPPALTSVVAGGPNQVTVTFSEPVEVLTATNAANYQIDNGIAVAGAALDAAGLVVTLQTSSHGVGPTYTLTVNGVRDRAAAPNTIASNTQASYTFADQLTISSISVASGEPYVVAQPLSNGSLAYIDRTFGYSNVPQFLLGAQYIRTANDDKQSQGSAFLSFQVNRAVKVYVAHDDRYGTKPSWLQSFLDTGIGISLDVSFTLFEQPFPAGTVTLGGNIEPPETQGYSMYTVIVVADPGGDTAPAPPTGVDLN
ncbi:MAG TPA: DUF4185 domain-containing protein [Candidatus Polarisedimenticolaceae bacterium]|nr:DUF4185 domain-containing protein [Candidatus Polarisedimenticolaceae bacterium]